MVFIRSISCILINNQLNLNVYASNWNFSNEIKLHIKEKYKSIIRIFNVVRLMYI